MTLFSSDYLHFKQCPKYFWLHKHGLVPKNDTFDADRNNELKALAKSLFPGGISALHSPSATLDLLSDGVSLIYDGSFEYDDMVVVADILDRRNGRWSLYHITSSTSVHERNLDEITLKIYALSPSLPIENVYIMFINNEYVRGEELDTHQLFSIQEVTEDVMSKIRYVQEELNALKQLQSNREPVVDIGLHCLEYDCGAKERCWSHVPKNSVFDITLIKKKKAFELYNESIVSIGDIPKELKLSTNQRLQVDSFQQNVSIVNKAELANFASTFRYPLYFLDFESFQQPIPYFFGIKPYQQIPFQYSLHIQNSPDSLLKHREFLAKEGEDPRRTLAQRLILDIPKGSCSVAYNMGFEKSILKGLAIVFADLAEHLMDIHDHMVDLMIPFQKKWLYTQDMYGSYSIKKVLPALFPNDESLDYSKLDIQNGEMAMDIYARLHRYTPNEISTLRTQLLAYCKLDTYAMVKLWQKVNAYKDLLV